MADAKQQILCSALQNPLLLVSSSENQNSDRHRLLSISTKLAMELFVELLLTIALSLLLSLVIPLFFTFAPSGELKRASMVRSRGFKPVTSRPKLEVEPKSRGCGIEGKIGFLEKVVEYKTEPVRGFVSEGRKSSAKGFGEPEFAESTEKCIEEVSVENLVDENLKTEKLCEIQFDNCGDDGIRGGLSDLEDDWEGIERTELEKVFGAAVAFVGSSANADRVSSLGSDVKMQLYGLHKIATQGPCHEPQPMAFKLSARAKWNNWQRLGNMSPEVAMEQYITLLSRIIPEWRQDDFVGVNKQDPEENLVFSKLASTLKALPPNQPGAVDEREMEKTSCVEGLHVTGFGIPTP